jgi:outer membrane receptor protein involved in Fe transport
VYEQDTSALTSLEWVPGRSHRVVAGFDLARDRMDSNVSDVSTTTLRFPRLPAPIVQVESESPVNETRQDSAGLFLQDEWTLRPGLKAVLGARYNWFDSALLYTTNPNLATGSKSVGHVSFAGARLRAHREERAACLVLAGLPPAVAARALRRHRARRRRTALPEPKPRARDVGQLRAGPRRGRLAAAA